MFKTLLVAALLALAVEARPNSRLPRLDGRIVGGYDVDIEEHPYQVSLQYYGSHFCGGSIIAPNKILTAAHCTVKRKERDHMSIRYGSTTKEDGGDVVQVKDVEEHSSFDSYTLEFDVSVITLVSDIQMGKNARIVELVPRDAVEGGRTAVVTGWGVLESGGPFPTHLKAVKLREVSRTECNVAYEGVLTDVMICFGEYEKDSCQGDSGGPLVSDDGVQVGIVSWGWGCADRRWPGIYSNVQKLRDFINV
ncbi:trypsin epsilon-like [Photinus pyralis]|nr:trypsin epsilon-like [Photinus pyralis]